MHEPHSSDDPAGTDSALTRRQVMAVAGLGAAAGTLYPLVGARPAAAAPSAPAPSADAPVPRMLSDGRYPIGIWEPPTPLQTDDVRYRQIAEAGFTFVIGGNNGLTDGIQSVAMTLAATYGLDFIAGDTRLGTLISWFNAGGPDAPFMLSDDEVHESVRKALAGYTSNSAFAGIRLFDEPAWDAARFAQLAVYVKAVQELAPTALPWINMLGRGFIDYYRDFIQAVNPSFLSFDLYPLLTDIDDARWFGFAQNVRTAALEAGIPYWSFIQSVQYAGHRVPKPAELSWQIGIALAYGFTGIEYFTYSTPAPPFDATGYDHALLTPDGELTDLWYAAKHINPILQSAGKRILPLTNQSVSVSVLDPAPGGLPGFTPDDWIATAEGAPVVIGQFAATPDAPQRTLIIANWSHDQAATTVLTPGPGVTHAVVEDIPGHTRPRSVTGPIRLTLAPGAFALITLDSE